MSQLRSQAERESEFSLAQRFVLFRLSTEWIMPTHIGKATSFTQSTDSNAHLTHKQPHRHAQKQCSTKYLVTVWPAHLDT